MSTSFKATIFQVTAAATATDHGGNSITVDLPFGYVAIDTNGDIYRLASDSPFAELVGDRYVSAKGESVHLFRDHWRWTYANTKTPQRLRSPHEQAIHNALA